MFSKIQNGLLNNNLARFAQKQKDFQRGKELNVCFEDEGLFLQSFFVYYKVINYD